MRSQRTPLLFLFALAQACAGPAANAAPRHDEPVAEGEPRATLLVQVDLPKTAACEENFDLALYGSRAIDLVSWEGTPTKCSGRKAKIRYLPKRITREALMDQLKKLATKVEVVAQ